MYKKVLSLLLVLCFVICLCSCETDKKDNADLNDISSSNNIKSDNDNSLDIDSIEDKPEVIAKKYVSAYCSGNWEQLLSCCLTSYSFDDLVKMQADALINGEKEIFYDEYIDATSENNPNDYKMAVADAYNLYKKDVLNYYNNYNITISFQRTYKEDEMRRYINDTVDELTSDMYDETPEFVKKLILDYIIDPNEVQSMEMVNVNLKYNCDGKVKTDVENICLIKIDGCWKVYISSEEFWESFVMRVGPFTYE